MLLVSEISLHFETAPRTHAACVVALGRHTCDVLAGKASGLCVGRHQLTWGSLTWVAHLLALVVAAVAGDRSAGRLRSAHLGHGSVPFCVLGFTCDAALAELFPRRSESTSISIVGVRHSRTTIRLQDWMYLVVGPSDQEYGTPGTI